MEDLFQKFQDKNLKRVKKAVRQNNTDNAEDKPKSKRRKLTITEEVRS